MKAKRKILRNLVLIRLNSFLAVVAPKEFVKLIAYIIIAISTKSVRRRDSNK